MDYNYINIEYPELYYRIYPKAVEVVNKYANEIASEAEISQDRVEKMIDEVYDEMIKELPEVAQDPMERRSRYKAAQRPFFGRRRLLRDIIAIILISEILRRRNPYGYGPQYGYSPGYRYGAEYEYGTGYEYGPWY